MAKIFSQLERAQLENLSVDPTPGTKGRVFFNTTEGVAKIDTGTAIVELGSGTSGGSGNQNYITNDDAETNTDGWATYADAAAATPVDGTGGAASSTLTRSTVSPLRGTGSFLFSKSAANRQGEGFSYDFTIDAADINKSVTISFDLLADSGFVVGDSSDIRVFIYDITAASIIIPSQSTIQGASGKFQARFDTTANTSYRLIFHVATVSATAYTLKLDSVTISVTDPILVPVVSDWEAMTVTGTWVTNATYTASRLRIGNCYVCQVKVSLAGAPTATALQLTLPFTIDTIKLNSSEAGVAVLSNNVLIEDDSASLLIGGSLVYQSATSVAVKAFDDAAAGISATNVTQASPVTFAVNDTITIWFTVPVVGLSPTAVLSSATTFKISSILANGTRVTATPTSLGQYRSLIKDAAANSGTDSAPTDAPSAVNGMRVYGNVAIAAAGTAGQIGRWVIFVGKNKIVNFEFYQTTGRSGQANVDYFQESATVAIGLQYSYNPISGLCVVDGFYQAAGTTSRSAALALSESTTGIAGDADIFFDINVSEKVIPVQLDENAIVLDVDTTATAVVSGNTPVFTLVRTDTRNGYNASTGVYTIQQAGKYLVTARVDTNAVAAGATGQSYAIFIQQSGSVARLRTGTVDFAFDAVTARTFNSNVAAFFTCAEGDQLKVVWSENIPAVNATNSSNNTYFQIMKLADNN